MSFFVQCNCGRFMARAHPVLGWRDGGYSAGEYIADVRGDCSRCGADIPAAPGWWHSWDAWKWEES